jgi:hypothetical protein
VKKKVGQVMFTGVQTEKLAVEHMRKPGHRMPVSNIRKPKGPFNALARQTGLYVLVLIHIQAIIETYKVMMAHLPVNNSGSNNKKKADKNV